MQTFRILGTGSVLMALGAPAPAYDVNDQFSIGGVIAGSMQCQRLSRKAGADNECDGALPLQPELSFRPTDSDEFFVKAGFAKRNGLNGKSPFVLAPWAAYLHDDVKNINGSSRDYLLTTWYQHSFTFHEDSTLDATVGIIDATDYLDENAYANDEYTQFMNEALVNGPNAFLPSYDAGGALGWDAGPWSLHGVVMKVNENDDGNDFTFYGAQLGYKLQSGLGVGNYRVLVDRTSKDFIDGDGEARHKRASILFSFDQQLGNVVGAFLRFGWQDDSAAVNYDAIWSGGIDINGSPWKRADDNIGLGYAYLDGGNMAIRQSQVAEAYYRFVINSYLALSADIQYMKDELQNQENPAGFIYGMRLTAEF
jgi:Carbohydrate-selective porin, OprB family